MIYTIAAEAAHRGIRFQPGELEPLGVTQGSTCWGVWVDSRDLPERSRLDNESVWFNNQCPHLVVSPLHPNRWLTSFRLQVLMERKEFNEDHPPVNTSSLYGVCDALNRCGVNVLFCNTALVGYDLFVLSATCEIPALRPSALGLIADSDQKGAWLTDRRIAVAHETAGGSLGPTLEAELKEAQGAAMDCRRAALAEVGRLMLRHLAELEARLRLIDLCRFRTDQINDPARDYFLGIPASDPLVRIVCGDQAGNQAERDKGFLAPWFCHRRAVERGENPYFVPGVQDILAGPSSPLSSEDDPLPDALRSTDVPHLYNHLRAELNAVAGRGSFTDDPSPDPTPTHGVGAETGSDPGGEAMRRMHGAASILPVRVTPSPSLAYARCWALQQWQRFAVPNALPESPFVEFKYDGRSLQPVDRHKGSRQATKRFFDFLNAICDCDAKKNNRGEFAHDSKVVAALHTPDRFMRLRFVRDQADQSTYCRVVIPFDSATHGLTIVVDGQTIPSSHGLLARCTRILAERHFRIEKLTIHFDSIEDSVERGTITLIVQATSREGAELLADETKTAAMRAALQAEIRRVGATDKNVGTSTPLHPPTDERQVSVEVGMS